MIKFKKLFPLSLAFTLFSLQAADPGPAEQQAAAAALCAQSVQHKIVTDNSGNVIKLAISNHNAFMKDKNAAPPTPITAAVFRENIVKLPHLEAIGLEKQTLLDEDYALLGQLKKLSDVRLHYMNDQNEGATQDAPMFINQLPIPLTVLELKHNFKISGGCMDRLKPQPKLEKLEIDTGYAGNEATEFILAAKGLRNLQLHRTSLSDANFQRIVKGLPDLEILEVRPEPAKKSDISGSSLKALENHPSLEILRMSQYWKEIPYENGLDALATIPTLKVLWIGPRDVKVGADHPAIQKLHQARPDLRIQFDWKNGIGGGENPPPPPNIDKEFNWDGGVTTHG